MEVTDNIWDVDTKIWCECLQWDREDEVDTTLKITQSLGGNRVQGGEYHGLLYFSLIMITFNC